MSVTLSLLHNPFRGLWFPHFSPPLRNTLLTIPLPDILRNNSIKKIPSDDSNIKGFFSICIFQQIIGAQNTRRARRSLLTFC